MGNKNICYIDIGYNKLLGQTVQGEVQGRTASY